MRFVLELDLNELNKARVDNDSLILAHAILGVAKDIATTNMEGHSICDGAAPGGFYRMEGTDINSTVIQRAYIDNNDIDPSRQLTPEEVRCRVHVHPDGSTTPVDPLGERKH